MTTTWSELSRSRPLLAGLAILTLAVKTALEWHYGAELAASRRE